MSVITGSGTWATDSTKMSFTLNTFGMGIGIVL